MELEEMKKTWSTLDNRLKENNSLNERIIREILERKAGKSLNKLIFWDGFAIATYLAIIPFATYWLLQNQGKLVFVNITMIYVVFLCVSGIVWYFYKMRRLFKIDVNGQISNNIFHINKYKIHQKREVLISSMFSVFIPIFISLAYIEMKVSLKIWMLMTFALVLAVFVSVFIYGRIYPKNINAIQHSLDEINDLKEE